MRQTRQDHVRRGEDPDDFEVVLQDMAEDMMNAREMLTAELESRGIDPGKIEPPPPPSPAASRLQEVATRHVVAVGGIIGRLDPVQQQEQQALADELQRMAMTLAGKVAHVSGDIGADGHLEGHTADRQHTVLILLLMEHAARTATKLMDRLLSTTPGLRLSHYPGIRAELDGLLAPLFQALTAEDCQALDALIAAGKAPSPFCTLSRNPSDNRAWPD